MTTAVKAIYEDGVFKPMEPVSLEDRTEVELLIQTPEPVGDDPWKTVTELMGCIKNAPPDMAENHDFYLYGLPRR